MMTLTSLTALGVTGYLAYESMHGVDVGSMSFLL